MNCKKTTGRLNALLDGELSPKQAAAVREHLQVCAQCAAALEELRGLNRALELMEGMAPPRGFVRRVRATAEARSLTPGVAGWRLNIALARFAAAATLVAGLWLGVAMGGSLGGRSDLVAQADELSLFDLQVDSLSGAPVGSLAETYLAFVSEGESTGLADWSE